MKRTIAPVLSMLVQNPRGPWALESEAQARRELRALKAVANAVSRGVAHSDYCARQLGETECTCPSRDALRALSRLDRARSPGRSRR